jgi:CheY-like chemotaxis protein
VAENGQEAISKIAESKFDLILMDVQMPVMDGLEATTLIRGLPGFEAVPILAMTANAFEEDRRKCIEAGMNDHLVKPVEPEILYKCLIKWLPVRKNEPENKETRQSDTKTDRSSHSVVTLEQQRSLNSLRQVAGLKVESGLRILGGDVTVYLRLIQEFGKKCQTDADHILKQLAEQNVQSILQMSHSIKGLAGNLGAVKIQELAAELEQVIRVQSVNNQSERQIGNFIKELRRFADVLLKVIIIPGNPRKDDIDKAQVEKIINRLVVLLENNDTEAYDLFEEHKDLLMFALGDTGFDLERQIHEFDYRDALKTLNAIRFGRSEDF